MRLAQLAVDGTPSRRDKPIMSHYMLLCRIAVTVLVPLALGCPSSSSEKDTAGSSKASAPASATAAGKASSAATAGSDGSVAPPKGERLQIAVGQWTRHKITSKDGNGTATYAITAKEGSAHWMSFDYKLGATTFKMEALVDFGDLKSFKDADIQKARVTLPNGQKQTLTGATLNPMKDKLGEALSTLGGDMKGDSQEDVSVPAGTFRQCYKAKEDVTAFGIASKSTIWRHTAVPLTTMVKMVTSDGNTWELDGYGLKDPPK